MAVTNNAGEVARVATGGVGVARNSLHSAVAKRPAFLRPLGTHWVKGRKRSGWD